MKDFGLPFQGTKEMDFKENKQLSEEETYAYAGYLFGSFLVLLGKEIKGAPTVLELFLSNENLIELTNFESFNEAIIRTARFFPLLWNNPEEKVLLDKIVEYYINHFKVAKLIHLDPRILLHKAIQEKAKVPYEQGMLNGVKDDDLYKFEETLSPSVLAQSYPSLFMKLLPQSLAKIELPQQKVIISFLDHVLKNITMQFKDTIDIKDKEKINTLISIITGKEKKLIKPEKPAGYKKLNNETLKIADNLIENIFVLILQENSKKERSQLYKRIIVSYKEIQFLFALLDFIVIYSPKIIDKFYTNIKSVISVLDDDPSFKDYLFEELSANNKIAELFEFSVGDYKDVYELESYLNDNDDTNRYTLINIPLDFFNGSDEGKVRNNDEWKHFINGKWEEYNNIMDTVVIEHLHFIIHGLSDISSQLKKVEKYEGSKPFISILK